MEDRFIVTETFAFRKSDLFSCSIKECDDENEFCHYVNYHLKDGSFFEEIVFDCEDIVEFVNKRLNG